MEPHLGVGGTCAHCPIPPRPNSVPKAGPSVSLRWQSRDLEAECNPNPNPNPISNPSPNANANPNHNPNPNPNPNPNHNPNLSLTLSLTLTTVIDLYEGYAPGQLFAGAAVGVVELVKEIKLLCTPQRMAEICVHDFAIWAFQREGIGGEWCQENGFRRIKWGDAGKLCVPGAFTP